MTGGGYREVDHDLLADYLGGALDGTPDENLVARLVDEDADWAQAHALLAPAVADVRADLAAWGASAPEMPADVADRIVAALAHATASDPGTVDSAALDPSEPGRSEPGGRGAEDDAASAEERPEGQPAVRTGIGAVPTQPLGGSGRRPAGVPRSEPGRGGATGPGRRRRRWTRLAGPVALAAVSIAAVGLGVSQLTGDQQTGGAADSALPGAVPREDADPAATPFRISGEPSVRSGTDYTPESLTAVPPSPKSRPFTGGPSVEQSGVQAEGGRLPGSVTGLDRLTDPAALGACIGEIKAEHGRGPLVVEVVDYARFQGRPALIVRFTDATGAHWAWASGPECGVPGSGSDSRYRTRVG